MEMKTLSELATLAAKHVPGFEAPVLDMGQWLEADNSPAALLMAVNLTPVRVEKTLTRVFVVGTGPHDVSWEPHDGTPESIARAALVALLRAHGVEVG